MKLQIFAVRDRQSNQFGSPMFLQSAGVFLRSLSDEINKGPAESVLRAHPEDFEAFHLGEWDSDTSRFQLLPDPQSVMLCSNLKVNGSAS